jgi:hypothetical protein
VEYHSARAGRSCVLFGGRGYSKSGETGGSTGDFGKTVFALETDGRNFQEEEEEEDCVSGGIDTGSCVYMSS